MLQAAKSEDGNSGAAARGGEIHEQEAGKRDGGIQNEDY